MKKYIEFVEDGVVGTFVILQVDLLTSPLIIA